ncbi:hypothetical protein EVAR_47705_1 [Eumeta japonica]|uniref:Mariner Mos1 transposase n=1 Tax=Eumeta variegata TaxID=151549 RepID=A0A4C1XR98_EUMVA|nr:hypothetical protein EVAR_47705_1 [Eumeta japonica]
MGKFDGDAKKNVYEILIGEETWLYKYDSKIKRQLTLWCFENEPTRTKCRCARSVQIQMVATFLCKTGHVATLVLQDHLTCEWYMTVCAPAVLSDWCDKRSKSRFRHLLCHHDDAAPHTVVIHNI